MMKEEFGATLFETIGIIGGIMSIDSQYAAVMKRDEIEKAEKSLVRRKVLQVNLAKQLPTLTDHEMDQILDRYPWVVRC